MSAHEVLSYNFFEVSSCLEIEPLQAYMKQLDEVELVLILFNIIMFYLHKFLELITRNGENKSFFIYVIKNRFIHFKCFFFFLNCT